MTTSRADLPVLVDRAGPVPLSVQITAQLRDAVTSGVLAAGERLPSTRDLAATLGVSRTVVTTAYAQLFAEGWLEGRHGSGTYVADVAPAGPGVPAPGPPGVPAPGASTTRASVLNSTIDTASASPAARSSAEPGWGPQREWGLPPDSDMIELWPGIPWAAGIEPEAWRRAWRYAGTRPPSFWYDAHGLPEVRAELAPYLRRSRGLSITPGNILVTRGVSSGLALLAAALVRPGDKAGVEEPGYEAAREVLRRAGAQVVPCRVDADGIIPDELPGDLRLLYTTPAHQYPLGGRLPVARRQAVTAWARSCGALVVEDDYDSEFRYDVAPLPALHSMDPDVVVYLGTASKTLTPALGAGWLVASTDLVELLARSRREVSDRVPEPVQHALLSLLASGAMERHIRRMRLEYARRRAALVSALTAPPAEAGKFRLLGDTAGMHVVLELPADWPAESFVAAAARRGVALSKLDRYYAGPTTVNGVVLGYGATPLSKVRRAAAELRALLIARDREGSGSAAMP